MHAAEQQDSWRPLTGQPWGTGGGQLDTVLPGSTSSPGLGTAATVMLRPIRGYRALLRPVVGPWKALFAA
jgi:hypothetical protein